MNQLETPLLQEETGVILTPKQQIVHDTLIDWCMGNIKAPFAVFTGYAGTGKSTTLTKVIDTLSKLRKSVGGSAPTHKAVKVLRIANTAKKIEYRTVHSWLSLKQQVNNGTGEISYVPDKDPMFKDIPVKELDVLILDETSMLLDDLFNFLVPYIKSGLKVIFTGDQVQIPQVHNERKDGAKFVKDCIPFRNGESWGALLLNLDEIIRQKVGNPILEFATEIRSDYKVGHFVPKHSYVTSKNEGIVTVPHASADEHNILEKYFLDSRFTEDSDFMKVIAWRNATVDKYNDIIRSIIYRDQPFINAIMLGEKILMEKSYIINARNIVTVSEELEVKEISQGSINIEFKDELGNSLEESIKVYHTTCNRPTDESVEQVRFNIVHEESKGAFSKLLIKLKEIALRADFSKRGMYWKQYYRTEGMVAWITYNYAITAHKSQGSSYQYALVLKWDIDYNNNIEERNRILYVAATRTRNVLFIES